MADKESDAKPPIGPPGAPRSTPVPAVDGSGRPRLLPSYGAPIIRERQNDSFDDALDALMDEPVLTYDQLHRAWHEPRQDSLDFGDMAPPGGASPGPPSRWWSEAKAPPSSWTGALEQLPSGSRSSKTMPPRARARPRSRGHGRGRTIAGVGALVIVLAAIGAGIASMVRVDPAPQKAEAPGR